MVPVRFFLAARTREKENAPRWFASAATEASSRSFLLESASDVSDDSARSDTRIAPSGHAYCSKPLARQASKPRLSVATGPTYDGRPSVGTSRAPVNVAINVMEINRIFVLSAFASGRCLRCRAAYGHGGKERSTPNLQLRSR